MIIVDILLRFVSEADYVLLQIFFDPNSDGYIFPMFSTVIFTFIMH